MSVSNSAARTAAIALLAACATAPATAPDSLYAVARD